MKSRTSTITYQDCIDDLYRFVIRTHGPLQSRNNLEGRLYNVANIYDVGKIYEIFNTIAEKNKPADLTIYIAGMPVAEALLQEFVINDMSIFMTLSAVVILLILFLTIQDAHRNLSPPEHGGDQHHLAHGRHAHGRHRFFLRHHGHALHPDRGGQLLRHPLSDTIL